MRSLHNYTFTLLSDSGRYRLTIHAKDSKSAIKQVLHDQNCPLSAIESVVKWHKNGNITLVKIV